MIQYGEYTAGNKPNIIGYDDRVNVTFGKFCSLADGIEILINLEHRNEWITTCHLTTRPQFKDISIKDTALTRWKGDVSIGHSVWIGRGVTILSGVSIGNGATIGAKAVIASDVPPYAVVAGDRKSVV